MPNKQYKVNIVIPAFNEEVRIRQTLLKYIKLIGKWNGQYDLKLYVVNDGSSDDTLTVVRSILNSSTVKYKVFSLKNNSGKGYAVKYGILNSRKADYYYIADADYSAKWNVLFRFLKIATEESVDCIIGSRALKTSSVKNSFYRKYLGALGNKLVRVGLGLSIEDTQCGYKLFSQNCISVFANQSIDRWGFDFEILYYLTMKGVSIKETTITWVNKEGSKITLNDYIKTLVDLIKVALKIRFLHLSSAIFTNKVLVKTSLP